jgi:hypothetical protein
MSLHNEVQTIINLKGTIFSYITPCRPLRVNRRFGGTYRFYLQGRKISPITCFHAGFLFGLFFGPEGGGDCSYETLVDSTDYTALYPRGWKSS